MYVVTRRLFLALAVAIIAASAVVPAQRGGQMTAEQMERRWQLERELQSLAIVDRKVMMPMRDGVRLATDIYRPKNASGKVPIVFVKTPYNFNYWDVRNRVPSDMTAALTAIKRGYAYVVQNERGHFFSEGNYDILGPPATDGYDTMDWLGKQEWSNGKVGATGCSSTAEYQPAVAAQGHPAFAAMNVQGFGAGIGRVGPYFEQGNWYRGGAVQMLFITWIYGQQNQVRPMFPPNTPQADLVAASRLFDLAPQMPSVDWSKALAHLPAQDILKNVDAPRGIFADDMPVATGGRMIQRTPNDPAWYKGGLWHDNMPINVPGLWYMSWYDVSVGPNLEAFNHVRKTAQQGSPRSAVGDHRAGRALRLHPGGGDHGRRRARHGRRAPRLPGDHVRLLRPLPQRPGGRASGHVAEGDLLHDGLEQVAVIRDVAAGRRSADDAVPREQRPCEYAER